MHNARLINAWPGLALFSINKFYQPIFSGRPMSKWFSRWVFRTTPHLGRTRTYHRHSWVLKVVYFSRLLLRFETTATLLYNQAKFRTFWPAVKITGGEGEMS